MLFEKKNTGSEGGCHANIKKKHVPCRENMYTDLEWTACLLHLRNSKEATKEVTEMWEEESNDV